MARTSDWVGQVEWLHGEVARWLGAEETLKRSCNVCRAWRQWCNTDLRVLHVGNDFQRRCCGGGGDSGRGTATANRTAGLSIPLFLPLVPTRLTELHLSGAWSSVPARELGTVRRGCRLKKLVLTGVRLFSFSYRELLLFEHLEELDISNSQMDIPPPPLRFDEPADGKPSRLTASTPSGAALSPPPPPPQRTPIIPARGRVSQEGFPTSGASAPFASSLRAGQGRRRGRGFANAGGGGGSGGGGVVGGRGGCCGAFDAPRFAANLKRLVAVRTRLWNRWDLSTFASLSSIEVSFAGRTMLKQLHGKAEVGSRLTELSVCDVALRNLVRPTELTELAEAIGGAATFRLRRVDVVKEVPNLAYLRAILGRLRNLQVLELTDVGLDDSMLKVLGEVFTSARVTPSSSSSSAAAAARGGGPEDEGEPEEVFFPSANRGGGAFVGTAREQQEKNGGGSGGGGDDGGGSGDGKKRSGGGGATGTVSLRTLILGHCGGVSEAAFETFLDVAGGGCGTASSESNAKRASSSSSSSSTSKPVGGGAAAAAASGAGAGSGRIELSTVRFQGCKALGDRGLAMLCAGAKERLSEIQVAGSLLLTDTGVEHLARSCPRLKRVDISGCPGITSNSLVHLLARCPLLREVKAWGIRFASAGGLGGAVASGRRHQGTAEAGAGAGAERRGEDRGPSSPDAASVSALRRAFQARGVELAWAGPLLPAVGGQLEGRVRNRGSGGGGDGWTEGDGVHGGGGDLHAVEGAETAGEAGAVTGQGRRYPCRLGCGARLKIEDAEDHVEVCPLASVSCLLQADGCKWRGTRRGRRRHLETCQMWQVKCPVCCQAVHMKEFGDHVLSHSAAGELCALHPPGCALRAYGCRAYRATTASATTASTAAGGGSSSSSSSSGGGGGDAPGGPRNSLVGSSGTSHSCKAAAASAASAVGATAIDATVTARAAAASAAGAAAEATEEVKEVDSTETAGAGEEVDGKRGRVHNSPGICPYYRVVCKSCDQEMSRKEWDAGEHSCPVQRRVDVLAKHASGAGKLRNRQWLIVYGYIGSGGKKGTAEGWEDRDTHFHGVNPMCAMPSGLSAALPLPGPAGAPISPATPPSQMPK